jgi:hypothetical protein
VGTDFERWTRAGGGVAPKSRPLLRPKTALRRPEGSTRLGPARRKLSFKEQRELAELPARLEALEAEARGLERARGAAPDSTRSRPSAIREALARVETREGEIDALFAAGRSSRPRRPSNRAAPAPGLAVSDSCRVALPDAVWYPPENLSANDYSRWLIGARSCCEARRPQPSDISRENLSANETTRGGSLDQRSFCEIPERRNRVPTPRGLLGHDSHSVVVEPPDTAVPPERARHSFGCAAATT